jgi:hypothetical protein
MTRSKESAGYATIEPDPVQRTSANLAARTFGQIPGGSIARSTLAIQLWLDPGVRYFRLVSSLPVRDQVVPIQMLVADTNDGRVAFDIVDDRPERDLDEDGLLLIALQLHAIRLVEIDSAAIEADPRGSNCRNIWRHRDRLVHAQTILAVERALGECADPTIRSLGDMIGVRHPMPTVCALICQRRLGIDLDKRLTLQSIVRRANDRSHLPALLTVSNVKIGARR